MNSTTSRNLGTHFAGEAENSALLLSLLKECGTGPSIDALDSVENLSRPWIWLRNWIPQTVMFGKDKGVFGALLRSGLSQVVHTALADHRLLLNPLVRSSSL